MWCSVHSLMIFRCFCSSSSLPLCLVELVLWEKITLGPQAFLGIIPVLASAGSYTKNLTTPEYTLEWKLFVFFIIYPYVWDIGYSVLFRLVFVAYNSSFLYSLLKIISYGTTIFQQYDYLAFLWSSTSLQVTFPYSVLDAITRLNEMFCLIT